MKLITTYDKLNQWLEENDYFEDGHILRIEDHPLAITVGYTIKGNYKANTEKHIRSFTIAPNKILQWNDSLYDLVPSDVGVIESIEPLEVESGIGLQFFMPTLATLVAESFNISEPEIIKTTFKPWVNTEHVFATAPMDEIPKPIFWKQKLQEKGYDIVFRYYAGESKQIEQIPYPDYTGYFIQLADKVGDTQEGILIEYLSIENHEVSISFKKMDENLAHVWMNLTAILADIPKVKINCGNCEFTGDEWKQFLKDPRIGH